MKTHIVCSVVLLLSFILSAADKTAVKSNVPPQVTPLEQYREPSLSEKNAWTMVLVPDTQVYVKLRQNEGIADLMFSWIAANTWKLKIQQVLVAGDIVDSNRTMKVYPAANNNQTGWEQWQSMSRIIGRLDGVVPYILATGNHDYGERSAEDRHTYFNKFFYPGRNSKLKNILVNCGPNSFGDHTLENAAYEFKTPNGQKLLVVSLGFSPTDAQLKWAGDIFGRPAYKNHFGVLLTHAYLDINGRLRGKAYAIDKLDGNVGEDIFQKLVRVSPNIRLVLCGHISGSNNWKHCVNFQSSKNDAGKTVYEMLFDPQALGGGWSGNGGDGWIRLLEFSKDMKTVKVRTFSPLFAASPSTRHLAWHTEPFNEFVFKYED